MQPVHGIRGWLSPTLVVLDDRGVRTNIVTLDDLRATLREADRLGLYRPILKRSGLGVSRVLHVAVGVCAAWTLTAWALPSSTLPVALGGLVVSGLAWVVYDWPNRMARRVRRAMVEHGRCPACAYELRLNEPEADHRVVCVECGSAWLPVD